MRKFLFLSPLQRLGDVSLLLLRLFVGLFLVGSVWEKVTHADAMVQFADFLARHHVPSPEILAPLSVYMQLAIGVAFVLGLLTRWAGILCVITFTIAIVMVDRFGGLKEVFPSGCLVVMGLHLACYGAGKVSLDAAIGANEMPRPRSGGVRFGK
jgi:putative oxidoreductase